MVLQPMMDRAATTTMPDRSDSSELRDGETEKVVGRGWFSGAGVSVTQWAPCDRMSAFLVVCTLISEGPFLRLAIPQNAARY